MKLTAMESKQLIIQKMAVDVQTKVTVVVKTEAIFLRTTLGLVHTKCMTFQCLLKKFFLLYLTPNI